MINMLIRSGIILQPRFSTMLAAEHPSKNNVEYYKMDCTICGANYYENLDNKIKQILSRPENTTFTFDLLEIEKSKENKKIVLQEKHLQMKIGEIWQEAIGSYTDFENLRVGHETGLDIISHKRKIAIELKNRTNTDNASSKKSNFDKLANFKQNNPEYKCIYATLNADTEEKTYKSLPKIIMHNGVEIEHHIGIHFLDFIFGDYGKTKYTIDFIKECINKYTL